MFRKIINISVKMVQRYLPDPFVFAILLTFVAFACAVFVVGESPMQVVVNWGNGVWGLLGFAMQMALVLVCGSALADSKVVKSFVKKMASIPKTPVMAIAWVTMLACIACWINWGFGLIVGAVLAKEVAKQVKGVDYRLLIASAYSGFVVWHAGLSASIPLAMATSGSSLKEVSGGIITEAINISETILAPYNLLLVLLVIVALTVVNSLMHPNASEAVCIDAGLLRDDECCDDNTGSEAGDSGSTESSSDFAAGSGSGSVTSPTPAERFNNSKLLVYLVCLLGFGYLFINIFINGRSLDLNSIILLFLMLGLLLHRTPAIYVKAITNSASSAAGILLQFPFYAGIMGIMTSSSADGISLAGYISEWCVSVANENTFPILSFLSAGVVNIFVPSGGGQWAVQGPIMIPAGAQLGVSPAITGMAIAWGDAWTNLIQPFWALPALAIAKLDAKDIMGFCLINLVVTGVIIWDQSRI